jgi:hypothetical protein
MLHLPRVMDTRGVLVSMGNPTDPESHVKNSLCFRPGPAACSILPSYCAVMRTIVSQTSHACRASGKKGDISTAAPLEHLAGLDPVVEFLLVSRGGATISQIRASTRPFFVLLLHAMRRNAVDLNRNRDDVGDGVY